MFKKLIDIANAFDGNNVEYVADTKFMKTLTVKRVNGDTILSILNSKTNVGACVNICGKSVYWLYFNNNECSVEGCVAFVKESIVHKTMTEIEYIIRLIENGIDSDYTVKHMKKNSMNNDSFSPAYNKLVYQKNAYKNLKPFWM